MRDLYAVLCVGRKASAASVRKMYRKLAARYHPDHNPGDESVVAKYHEVVLAYEVLSDPDRRKQYDRTGSVDVPRQTPDGEILEVVMPVLLGVIQNERGDVKSADVLGKVTDRVRAHRDDAARQRDAIQKGRDTLLAVCGRFTVDGDPENVLAAAVRSQLPGVEAELAKAEAERAKLDRVLGFLKRVAYRRDAKPAPDGAPFQWMTVSWGAK